MNKQDQTSFRGTENYITQFSSQTIVTLKRIRCDTESYFATMPVKVLFHDTSDIHPHIPIHSIPPECDGLLSCDLDLPKSAHVQNLDHFKLCCDINKNEMCIQVAGLIHVLSFCLLIIFSSSSSLKMKNITF
jgi:hypothetical protein